MSVPPPGWKAKVKDQGNGSQPDLQKPTGLEKAAQVRIPGQGHGATFIPKDTIFYPTPLFNLEVLLSPRPQTPFYNPLLTPHSLPGRQRKTRPRAQEWVAWSTGGAAGLRAEPWGRGCEQLTWCEHPAPLLSALLCGHHADRLRHSPVGLPKPLDVRHPPCVTHQLQGKDTNKCPTGHGAGSNRTRQGGKGERGEDPDPVQMNGSIDYKTQESVAPFPIITQPAGMDIPSPLQAALPDCCTPQPDMPTLYSTVMSVIAELKKRPQALKSDQPIQCTHFTDEQTGARNKDTLIGPCPQRLLKRKCDSHQPLALNLSKASHNYNTIQSSHPNLQGPIRSGTYFPSFSLHSFCCSQLTTLLFLKHTNRVSSSGPLHILLPLPR